MIFFVVGPPPPPPPPPKLLVNVSAGFSGISDLRLVDNCLKTTEYDGIGENEL